MAESVKTVSNLCQRTIANADEMAYFCTVNALDKGKKLKRKKKKTNYG